MATVEIERKFLVHAPPAGMEGWSEAAIVQGYFGGGEHGVHMRLRASHKGKWLTVKHGSGIARTEVEVALSDEQFDALWPLTEGRRLEKVRYSRQQDAFLFDFDVYRGPLAGLMVCEVEFVSLDEAEAFMPPDWLGPEVTADKRYSNFSLAVAQAIPEPGR